MTRSALLLLLCVSVAAAEDPAAKLEDYLARCERFGFSGAVLVALDGEILLRKGYGLADRAAGVPNTPDTLYDIASASKQFTAAAILKLESEGKLKTSDSIADHLPGVPERHREVTIHHLLTHTGGFARMGPSGGGNDLAAGIQGYLRAERPRPAGAAFEYYNGGYALLAAVVERVSGKPFPQYLKDEILAPAGLAATGFCRDPALEDAPVAHGYAGDKDVGLATAHSFGWEYQGMGGVVTSVNDLWKWDRALRAGKVLDEAAREKLYTPALQSYACGWYVVETESGVRCIQHGGTVGGFETEFMRFPDRDGALILITNEQGLGWRVAYNLRALLLGEPWKVPPPPSVAGAAVPVRLAGRYAAPGGGRLIVSAADGGFDVCAEGQGALRLLAGVDGDFETERARAQRIVAALVEGDAGPLGEKMMRHIPASWPGMVRDLFWPRHLAKWGPLASFEEIGARRDGGGRVRVWVRLRHEQGDAAVEIAFAGDELNIFDLNGRTYPARARYCADGEGRLVSYDFGRTERPPLAVAGGKLRLTTPEGHSVDLEPTG